MGQVLRAHDIGALAAQETHLDATTTSDLNTQFDKTLMFFNSSDVLHPNRKGVAFILNRSKVKCNRNDVKVHEIVAGRALQIDIPWRNGSSTLSLLNVYAPNDPVKNEEFWTYLKDRYTGPDAPPKPHFMLGDFNLVEDPIDHSPPHADRRQSVQALVSLRAHLRLVDGWRDENPGTKSFTWKGAIVNAASTPLRSESRIDRIYVRSDMMYMMRDWSIKINQTIVSDHEMVTAKYYDLKTPFLGKGRWEIPSFLMKNDSWMSKVDEMCSSALARMQLLPQNCCAEGTTTPQSIFTQLKSDIRDGAKSWAREMVPKIRKRIDDLLIEHAELNAIGQIPGNTPDPIKLDELEKEIKRLEHAQLDQRRDDTVTRFRLETETIGKAWFRSNRAQVPRDTILMLKDPLDPLAQPVKKSKDMARVMRDYHESLQNDHELTPEERDEAAAEALKHFDKYEISEEHSTLLSKALTIEEVRDAITSLPNGKASGPDRIPADFWKALIDAHDRHGDNAEHPRPTDVVKLLHLVFNDIEEHGAEDSFAEGWLCPIYKKKDRSDVANYRPITVLNADYKAFTKALTIRLAPVALDIIHPNQAGFLQGCHIDDHTELAKLMIEWCEMEDQDGLMVLLDQEKAYDCITHRFLAQTLERLRLPARFRKAVSSLYSNTETVAIVNGVISTPFQVKRGVRQGDPLSCLLFNLAIESLANTLRASPLKGLKVPGASERLITTLFADDTTVYLSHLDDFSTLTSILTHWCRASGAKFNVKKTEVIPVGSPQFRQSLLATRLTRPGDELSSLPPDLRITKEGEAVRMLGAFVGNHINDTSVWESTIETLETKLKFWEKSKPSIEGRSYLTKIEPGGRTQFRTVVQGMPNEIEKRIEKLINETLWASRPSGVNHATVILPYELGGKKVLDIKSRNEAIYLIRLQRYLSDAPTRPLWAYVADALIFHDIPASYRLTDRLAAINVFLQTWDTHKHFTRSRLPLTLFKMLEVGRKYNVTYAPPIVPRQVKPKLPVWWHPGRKKHLAKKDAGGKHQKCLRLLHGVYDVRDLVWYITNKQHPMVIPEPNQVSSI